MPHLRFAPALLLIVVLAACESLVGPRAVGPLSVEVEPSSLVLFNRTGAPVYHIVLEADYAARALWGPCSDPATCQGLPPNARATIRFEDIGGYQAGQPQTALVYWWHLVPAGGGTFRPDSIRFVSVPLH